MALENERPIGEILQDTVNDLSAITRSEIDLAKTELKSEAAELLRVAPLFIIGAVLGLFALGYLLTAALLALVIVIPPWAASLVIFV
ncbi:MAG: phage holin family protein, partial [Bryobacteraceae bacterium]